MIYRELIFIELFICISLADARDGEAQVDDLAPPFAVTVDGVPIDKAPDTMHGNQEENAYPWVGDFDGDGKPDLLIGQARHGTSREGHLRIYHNRGGADGPRLTGPTWFNDQVPTGRIPAG